MVPSWFAETADRLPLAYAYLAGLLAALNPCGFVMLPTYLALIATQSSDAGYRPGTTASLRHVTSSSLAMCSGFFLLVAVVGSSVALGGRSVLAVVPDASLAVGVLLFILGVGSFAGFRPWYRVGVLGPSASDARTVGAFLGYGVMYGIASMSCTLPLFLAVVGLAASTGSLFIGALQLLNYAIGMSTIVLVAAALVSIGRDGLLRKLRTSGRVVEDIAGAALIVAGSYLILYWFTTGRPFL